MIIISFVEREIPNTNIQSVKEEIVNISNMSKFYKYATCHNFVILPCFEYSKNVSLFLKK